MAGAVVVVEVADDRGIVVVHRSIQIGVTILGVLDQDGGGTDRLATEAGIATGEQVGVLGITDAEVEDIRRRNRRTDTACSGPGFTVIKLAGLAAAVNQILANRGDRTGGGVIDD